MIGDERRNGPEQHRREPAASTGPDDNEIGAAASGDEYRAGTAVDNHTAHRPRQVFLAVSDSETDDALRVGAIEFAGSHRTPVASIRLEGIHDEELGSMKAGFVDRPVERGCGCVGGVDADNDPLDRSLCCTSNDDDRT